MLINEGATQGACTLYGIGPCNLSSNAKLGVQYLNTNNYLDAISVLADLGEGQGHSPEPDYRKWTRNMYKLS